MKINHKILADSHYICDLKTSQLRIIDDNDIPWFLLIPMYENISELTDLEFDIQKDILKDINIVSNVLKSNIKIDKLNIASIGNIVSQLHIHIIGRNKSDRCWPSTIWGSKTQNKLSEQNIQFWKEKFKLK